MKKCGTCLEEKHESEFHFKTGVKLRHQCRDCCIAYSKNYYKTHKTEQKELQLKRYKENPDIQLRRYGLKRGDYDRMLNKQNGLCAICGSDKPGGRYGTRFHVDHCHDTNVVRGLLCGRCNCGIGNLKDSRDLLLKAAQYLHPEPRIDGVFIWA
mgnify:CR=1 FL=1